MNKLIVGGLLVTVMGGTPAATYFLTKDNKTSVEASTDTTKKTVDTPDEVDERTPACTDGEITGTCPSSRD